jgi:2-succinyl-5-enolpyruvyl-6-hydroxy-3-cyclohexene-1-carboxylate synthase
MTLQDLGSFTAKRCGLIIDTLYNQGITDICLAPGSRSTPLALAAAEHGKIRPSIHFDERSLGFYALGIAKATRRAVALLVTTGTAVANLFPAVMEAHLSGIPLLLLTADRPPELRDCGANQTADHVNFFGPYTRWDLDLAISDPLASDSYLTSSVAHAVAQATQSPSGPVQLNCSIREPFLSNHSSFQTKTSPIYEPKQSMPSEESLDLWAHLLSQSSKGLIVLGSDALLEKDISFFLDFANKLGWPIFSDIISGGRRIGNHPYHIEHFELLLKVFPDLQIDTLLQIGSRMVSKPLLQWIDRQKDLLYLLVADHPFRQDPLHKVSRRMECSTKDLCLHLGKRLSKAKNSLACKWKELSTQIKEEISLHFLEDATFSEVQIFHTLEPFTSSFPIYLSSSRPVRDADLLFFPKAGSCEIFCNRGASGIDGNVATAIGLSKGIQKPLIALLGDLAALHDLSSFLLTDKTPFPIIFIVINNQGGGIFSFLPVQEKKELFETFIATSHHYDFEPIAKMSSLDYFKVDSLDDFKARFGRAVSSSKSCIIECKTNRSMNVFYHQQLLDKVRLCLCSSTNLSEPLQTLLPCSSSMAF